VRRRLALTAAAVLLGSAGCGGTAAEEGTGQLTVFAAASLIDAFERLGGQLLDEHPGWQLDVNYGGSSSLARAITEGAPVDVFASADEAQMDVVADAGLAEEPVVFAANVLAIAVPKGNPAAVTGIADFARDDLTLAVCAPEVPCGAAAERLFAVAGVTAVPDTLEDDVRAALTKVELGEADAALVYASDVRAAGATVDGIDVPGADQVVNRYPIAVLTGARNHSLAQEFVDLVLSDDGRAALADYGFGIP
jgi:molybdate transport system substrate-binding protein